MPETASIVGIFGAIDRAVQLDGPTRARVGQLLRPYEESPTVKWYDEFLEWIAEPESGEGSTADFPGLVQGLEELAETGVEGRTRARRMFAIAVIKRAYPEMNFEGKDLREPAIAALRAPEKKGAKPVDAEGLYGLLTDDDSALPGPPGGRKWWKAVIETALARDMLPDTIGMYPQPCYARPMRVPGVTGPVAVIKTEWTTEPGEIAFEAATRFLEPVNWETCMPNFWCDMHVVRGTSYPPGRRRYHEIVSTHCADKGARGFWAETELVFDFMWIPNEEDARAAVANYQLAPERPLENDRILVDEGTLLVEKSDEDDTALNVTTTKRVKFSYPFMTEALPLIICALGYADMSGGLLCCAARFGKKFEGTKFPGIPPSTSAPGQPRTVAGGPRSRPGQPPAGVFAQDAIDHWARCMREWTTAIERGARAGSPVRPRSTPRRRS